MSINSLSRFEEITGFDVKDFFTGSDESRAIGAMAAPCAI